MTAHLAATAYAHAARQTAEPRSAEAQALARVNAHLAEARRRGRADMLMLADAVHRNAQLWTLFATDAAGDGNALPEAARAAIVSLALHVHRTGRAALRGEDTLGALVEINDILLAGLETPARAAA